MNISLQDQRLKQELPSTLQMWWKSFEFFHWKKSSNHFVDCMLFHLVTKNFHWFVFHQHHYHRLFVWSLFKETMSFSKIDSNYITIHNNKKKKKKTTRVNKYLLKQEEEEKKRREREKQVTTRCFYLIYSFTNQIITEISNDIFFFWLTRAPSFSFVIIEHKFSSRRRWKDKVLQHQFH